MEYEFTCTFVTLTLILQTRQVERQGKHERRCDTAKCLAGTFTFSSGYFFDNSAPHADTTLLFKLLFLAFIITIHCIAIGSIYICLFIFENFHFSFPCITTTQQTVAVLFMKNSSQGGPRHLRRICRAIGKTGVEYVQK